MPLTSEIGPSPTNRRSWPTSAVLLEADTAEQILWVLALVEHRGGRVLLTERGRHRYQSLPKAADEPGAEGLPDLATVLRRQWSGTGS